VACWAKRLKSQIFGDLRGLARWHSYCLLIWHFTNPFDQTTRGLINDYYLLSFALLATFKILNTFVQLHCFIIFFFTSNPLKYSSENTLANVSSPQSSSCSTHFWSSKGNRSSLLTDICCILIGLHHPLTVWSIRGGLFLLFASLFPASRFSSLFSARPPWCDSTSTIWMILDILRNHLDLDMR